MVGRPPKGGRSGSSQAPLKFGRLIPTVQLSAFSVVDGLPREEAAHRDRLSEVVGLARAADAAGLSALWVAEHHFHEGGLCPSPPILLSACGAVTRRLRLGVLVSVLPFHHPIELAEEYALLDRLTNGRLNLGFGSGYVPVEMEGFGVDPATKRERFDRAYDTVLAALRGETVAWGGAPVRLNVRPVQSPHPPLWIAVQRREAIPFVARRGVAVALVPYATVKGVEELADEVREYRAALPTGIRGHVSAAVHLYAGDHPDRARAALQRYLDSRLAHQSAFLQHKVERDPSAGRAETVESQGFALFGPPPEVAERLRAFERAGVDEVLGLFDFGGLSAEESAGSLRALAPYFTQ